jgi:hypothetical protein
MARDAEEGVVLVLAKEICLGEDATFTLINVCEYSSVSRRRGWKIFGQKNNRKTSRFAFLPWPLYR